MKMSIFFLFLILAMPSFSVAGIGITTILTRKGGWELETRAPNSADCSPALYIQNSEFLGKNTFFVNFVKSPYTTWQEHWVIGKHKDFATNQVTSGTAGDESIYLDVYKKHWFGKRLQVMKSLRFLNFDLEYREVDKNQNIIELCTYRPYKDR